jgi:hypothetical protein
VKKVFQKKWEMSGKKVGKCREISPANKSITHKINMLSERNIFAAQVGNDGSSPCLRPYWVPWRRTSPGARSGSARTNPPMHLAPHDLGPGANPRQGSANQARTKREKSISKRNNINNINVMNNVKKVFPKKWEMSGKLPGNPAAPMLNPESS